MHDAGDGMFPRCFWHHPPAVGDQFPREVSRTERTGRRLQPAEDKGAFYLKGYLMGASSRRRILVIEFNCF